MIVEARSKESEMKFLSRGAKFTFAKLRQAFTIGLILYYFDLKSSILIEIDISGYVMVKIFYWINLDNFN